MKKLSIVTVICALSAVGHASISYENWTFSDTFDGTEGCINCTHSYAHRPEKTPQIEFKDQFEAPKKKIESADADRATSVYLL
jgi:hypothetical protein